MKVNIEIDVNQLSTEQKIELVKTILTSDKNIEAKFAKALNTERQISKEDIRDIINDDFKRYDEVFKALA